MSADTPVRVLHFVTGGFTGGATQVAVKLATAAAAGQSIEPLLVLRRKRHTNMERVRELEAAGLQVRVVPGGLHWLTIRALVRICREFRPQVLVAHGFSEHLWGRYAGLLARVPQLVHVEHNTRERYTWWRLLQARWLARRTARIVGCSEGVRQRLVALGFPPERCQAIPNGINLQPFAAADEHPHTEREPAILMCSRFARQKDQCTLINALAILRERGLQPRLDFAGGGKSVHLNKAKKLVQKLQLEDQVQFLGVVRDVPQRLMRARICALITHYEGMPLALVEGMAAGCAVVGSDAPGVREIIRDGENGRLAGIGDAAGLADALQELLRDEALAARLGAAARADAVQLYSVERMHADYERLCLELAGRPAGGPLN